MSSSNPLDDIVSQYLAARDEAAQCRFSADQFTARAAGADTRADSLAAVITTLGGEVPEFPRPQITSELEDPPPAVDETLVAA